MAEASGVPMSAAADAKPVAGGSANHPFEVADSDAEPDSDMQPKKKARFVQASLYQFFSKKK